MQVTLQLITVLKQQQARLQSSNREDGETDEEERAGVLREVSPEANMNFVVCLWMVDMKCLAMTAV